MKKALLTMMCLMAGVILASAEDMKLDVPVMEPKLVKVEKQDFNMKNVSMEENYHWSWMGTKKGVKPYKFMDDMTFVGVPLFIAGMAVKGEKAMFRVNNKEGKKNTQLLTDFKTGIDDYTQYFGPAMVLGLKIGGVEGRSSWGRMLASAAMSYGIMAGLVNGIKYTAKEMRPDGSQANSWPSGHTATSFVGATLLHKEYGLTRSPWYSVAGYGVATATGVMRVLNNRHWVSDVMSGAGIGILATELGYGLSDIIFKGRGLLRNDLEVDFENPSFFGISMGVGLGSKDIDFTYNDLENKELYDPEYYDLSDDDRIKFRAATVVDAEGAYFFNKYIGIGGRFRVRAMSTRSLGRYADISTEDGTLAWIGAMSMPYAGAQKINPEQELINLSAAAKNGEPVTELNGIIKSDHLSEFTGSVGLYLNLPLSKSFAVGTKFLIGRSITQELDIDGHAKGYMKDVNYGMIVENSDITYVIIDQPAGMKDGDGYKTYDVEWEYLTMGANNSTSYGTGISLTYRYKSNFSWRLFCDYDYTKKTFTLEQNPLSFLNNSAGPNLQSLISNPYLTPYYMLPYGATYRKEKKMNYWTLGLSFLVNL